MASLKVGYGYLHEGLFDFIVDHAANGRIELRMSLLSEVLECRALQDLGLVNRDVVDAVALELLCVVGMRKQKHRQGSFRVHVFLEIVGTDVDETRQHEVVCVYEELNKEVKRVTQDLEPV